METKGQIGSKTRDSGFYLVGHLVLLADSSAERGDGSARDLDIIDHEIVEYFAVELQERRFFERCNGGGAGFGIEQRHFADDIASMKLCKRSLAIVNANAAFDNDIEAASGFAF